MHNIPTRSLVARMSAIALASCALFLAASARADSIGAGNAAAEALAKRSPLVRSGMEFLVHQAADIHDNALPKQTVAILTNLQTCAMHRVALGSRSATQALIQQLWEAGLVNGSDPANFRGGALAGIFPPILKDGPDCPQLPQPYFSAPGSGF